MSRYTTDPEYREQMKTNARNYRERHRNDREYLDKQKAWSLSSYYKKRSEFLEMYGRKCRCCGESIEEFLTIQHVKGQAGVSSKEKSYSGYKNALQKYRPDIYEILCMNCNHSIGMRGYCPHETLTKN